MNRTPLPRAVILPRRLGLKIYYLSDRRPRGVGGWALSKLYAKESSYILHSLALFRKFSQALQPIFNKLLKKIGTIFLLASFLQLFTSFNILRWMNVCLFESVLNRTVFQKVLKVENLKERNVSKNKILKRVEW